MNLSPYLHSLRAKITPNIKPTPAPPPALLISQERFVYLTQIVITNFEGGYYHPNMKHRFSLADQKIFGDSGETFYGLDRKHGAQLAIYPEWKEFWMIIDNAEASTKWPHNYMGGPYAATLKDIAGKIMFRWFSVLFNQYVTKEAQNIVANDDRLIIHFSYASWNGQGWFKSFSYALNAAVKKYGTNQKQRIFEEAIKARTEAPNSTIRKHGRKMIQLFNSMHL